MQFDKNLCRRETAVLEHLLSVILAKGWHISVNDGEEWVVRKSRDQGLISKALGSTGEDTLRIRDDEGQHVGTIWLIYGNGYDVINNHTCDRHAEFDALMESVFKHVESLNAARQ